MNNITGDKFQCCRCRFLLFTNESLSGDHELRSNCSLWYLCDDNILPWVLKCIDKSGWTKGKLNCPHCEARVGAFNFLHVISCECGGKLIPSIYCVKSKIDHTKSSRKYPYHDNSKDDDVQDKQEGFDGKNNDTGNAAKIDNNTTGSCNASSVVDQDACELWQQEDIYNEPPCCRVELNKASYDRWRLKDSLTCICKSGNIQNELVNVSYDASSHAGTVRSTHCWRQQGNVLPQNVYNPPAGNLDRKLTKARSISSQYVNARPSTYRDSRARPSMQRGIHEDLLEVQQELLNLQSIIQSEYKVETTRNARRRRRARERSAFREINTISILGDKLPQENEEKEEGRHDNGAELELPDNYQCPVCLDILYDPHTTICGHIFCAPCLRQLHKVSQRKPLCPLCRQRVLSVEPYPELQDDLKRLYPEMYRKRSRAELCRPASNYPLPSPTNVHFDREDNEQPGRFVRFLYTLRTLLFILCMIITFLLNGEERREHRRYARIIRWFFYGLIAMALSISGVCVGILFTLYAHDFMKFLIGLCLFYAVVTRLLVAFVATA